MKAITVVSLGPGSRDFLTLGAVDALKKAEKVILRTQLRCDAADYLREIGVSFETLDRLHEACDDFEELKSRAVDYLLNAAQDSALCYAVFDAAADETVSALREAAEVTVLPGVSIGDGTTIGAGSVVVGDIPAHCIAVGNPCRVVKKLQK